MDGWRIDRARERERQTDRQTEKAHLASSLVELDD